MSEETLDEWLEKAEEDYRVAVREMRTRGIPAYDAVCFHAEQRAEKYFKSFLVSCEIKFPKTHELRALCRLCSHADKTFDSLVESARA